MANLVRLAPAGPSGDPKRRKPNGGATSGSATPAGAPCFDWILVGQDFDQDFDRQEPRAGVALARRQFEQCVEDDARKRCARPHVPSRMEEERAFIANAFHHHVAETLQEYMQRDTSETESDCEFDTACQLHASFDSRHLRTREYDQIRATELALELYDRVSSDSAVLLTAEQKDARKADLICARDELTQAIDHEALATNEAGREVKFRHREMICEELCALEDERDGWISTPCLIKAVFDVATSFCIDSEIKYEIHVGVDEGDREAPCDSVIDHALRLVDYRIGTSSVVSMAELILQIVAAESDVAEYMGLATDKGFHQDVCSDLRQRIEHITKMRLDKLEAARDAIAAALDLRLFDGKDVADRWVSLARGVSI